MMFRRVALGLLVSGCSLSAAIAGPADYIYTPRVEEGEHEVDLKAGTARSSGGPSSSQLNIGLGWGASSYWFTELYAKFKGDHPGDVEYDAVEWENRFQLAETGRYPVDVGLLVEVERPRDHDEGWEVKVGPLLQADRGDWQCNLNLLLERSFDTAGPAETEWGWQAQVLWRWKPALGFGVQWFGEPGDTDHWDTWAEQEQRIGPMARGKVHLGGRNAIVWNGALLAGVTPASPDLTCRLQTEFEF